MTVKQFQELYYISSGPDTDIDKSIKMVGVITGKTPEAVEKMPMATFNRLCGKITTQFKIFGSNLLKGKPKNMVYINGHWYRLHYRIDREPINTGRYVEVISFGNDVVNNLHKIMASIAEPIKWRGRWVKVKRSHEDMANDFESMNFEAAYQAAVFFYTLYTASMPYIRPYLVRELKMKGIMEGKAEEILKSLERILDGCIMPKWSQNMRGYLLNRFGS